MFKNRMFWAAVVAIAPLVMLQVGCSPAVDEQARSSPIVQGDYAFACAILIDMSGSYADKMAKNGEAWDLILRILSQYFRDRLGEGTNDRLLIGQLSAAGKKTMLCEVSPLQFRQMFATQDAFRDWLVANSDPAGSRLFDGIREGADALMRIPGVEEGRTKSILVIASDMDDNASGDKGINYLLGSLNRYSQHGNVAMYFVEHPRVDEWNRNLKACGFKDGHFTVQSEIVKKPDLLKFAD